MSALTRHQRAVQKVMCINLHNMCGCEGGLDARMLSVQFGAPWAGFVTAQSFHRHYGTDRELFAEVIMRYPATKSGAWELASTVYYLLNEMLDRTFLVGFDRLPELSMAGPRVGARGHGSFEASVKSERPKHFPAGIGYGLWPDAPADWAPNMATLDDE